MKVGSSISPFASQEFIDHGYSFLDRKTLIQPRTTTANAYKLACLARFFREQYSVVAALSSSRPNCNWALSDDATAMEVDDPTPAVVTPEQRQIREERRSARAARRSEQLIADTLFIQVHKINKELVEEITGETCRLVDPAHMYIMRLGDADRLFVTWFSECSNAPAFDNSAYIRDWQRGIQQQTFQWLHR